MKIHLLLLLCSFLFQKDGVVVVVLLTNLKIPYLIYYELGGD